MIYDELVENIKAYANGELIGKETLLYHVNRALYDLYLYLPVTKSMRLYARGFKPTTYYKEIVYKGNSPVTINLNGKAFTMHVLGMGNYTIKDGESLNAHQFDTNSEAQIIRGFINSGGYIRFWGGCSFTVYNFAIYDDIASFNIEDIPDGSGITVFDMRKLCNNFLSFTSLPTDGYGQTIENCRLIDGRIELDSDYTGEINITYRRTPTEIIGIEKTEDYEEVIDINAEYIPLLINLFWYHYWYDSNETEAGLYKAKFDKLLSLHKEDRKVYDRKYVDVNGWA